MLVSQSFELNSQLASCLSYDLFDSKVSLGISSLGIIILQSDNITIVSLGQGSTRNIGIILDANPTLRSNQFRTTREGYSNLVVLRNKLLIGCAVVLNSLSVSLISAEEFISGKEDASARNNSYGIIVASFSISGAAGGIDSTRGFNCHSHGANHDDSQYQCEYFFHCDFLLKLFWCGVRRLHRRLP